MATELGPGVFERLFTEAGRIAVERCRRPLDIAAGAVEIAAKIEVSHGSHPYGTPTPARPGAGPAVISSTLRKSITHIPPRFGPGGWYAVVFPKPGLHPVYRSVTGRTVKSTTDSARYGYYLEFGDHGITYPWLGPAVKKVRPTIPGMFRVAFAEGWPVLA